MITLTVTSPAESLTSHEDVMSVTFAASAEDSLDTNRFMQLTYDWGDGSDAVTVDNFDSGGTLAVSDTHTYGIGVWTLYVVANNMLWPTPDKAAATVQIEVTGSASEEPPYRLIGPILPRDAGLPNRNTWALDVGVDNKVLESSLKSLLLTARGERLHVPQFGTNLRQLVFNTNTDELATLAHEDILTAIAAWEPRVELIETSVARSGNSVSIVVDVRSLVSGSELRIALPFSITQ